MDVVLVNPKARDSARDLEEDDSLHLMEIEAYLKYQSYETRSINTQKGIMSPKETAEEVSKYNPIIVCVWVMYRSLEYSMSLFKELGCYRKSPQRPLILASGYAATFSAVDLLKSTSPQELDAILLGEAEESLAEVINALCKGDDWRRVPGLIYRDIAGNIKRSPRRKLITNLDKFPVPCHHKPRFPPDQWIEIRSSRGCYHNCSFCNVGAFYGVADGPTWRGYSVSRVLWEITYMYEKGARCFYFVDDQFFGPGKKGVERVRNFALSLLNLGLDIKWQIFCRVDDVEFDLFQLMHQAGLMVVNMGIEGGSQTQLDRMNKRQTIKQIIQAVEMVRQIGITLIPSFIMFDPYVTLDEIEANIDLIEGLNFITYLGPNCTIPFSGTPFTEKIIADDLLDNRNPVISNFLPNVRMANPEAELLRTIWISWRSWINDSFGGLETKLDRAAYTYQVSTSSQLKGALESQYLFARRLKSLEADYVRKCICHIRNGSSLKELLAMRFRYASTISSITLAVSRSSGPRFHSERR